MTRVNIEEEFQRYSILHGEEIANMVDEIFRWVIDNRGTRVHLKKRSSSLWAVAEGDPGYASSEGGKYAIFEVLLENEDGVHPSRDVPIHHWHRLVSMLKVLAKTVDYGVRRSERSSFSVDVDKEWKVDLELPTNPDPYKDNEMVIEVDGISKLSPPSSVGQK